MRDEFEFIDHIKKAYGLDRIGDDCAVLPKDARSDLLLTADMLVENVDFRLDWTSPELLGAKVLAVSLSDIAAMGGSPRWSMLSIAVPEHLWRTDLLDRFYEGWHTVAKHYNVELIGGDISRSPQYLVFDSIVGGESIRGKAVLRSGARPGDAIYVTGCLGGAAGGLMLLESGSRYATADKEEKHLIERQLRPVPRLDIAELLAREAIATSMLDISDGLSSDLHHLCKASGVGALIYADQIPVDANLTSIHPTDDARIGLAVNGGEDFELLFTATAKELPMEIADKLRCIGQVTETQGVVEIEGPAGRSVLPPRGYRHF